MEYKIPVDIINILYICSHILNKLNEVIQRRNWVFNSSSTFVSFLYFLAQSEMNFFFSNVIMKKFVTIWNTKHNMGFDYQNHENIQSRIWLFLACLIMMITHLFYGVAVISLTIFFNDINRLLCFCTTHFTFNHNINHLTCTFNMNIFISEIRFTNIFLIIKVKGKLTLLSSIDEIYV